MRSFINNLVPKTPRAWRRTSAVTAALLAAAALWGCGADEGGAGGPTASDTSSLVWTRSKWATPGAIPVCYVNPGDVTDEVRSNIRWAVQAEIESKTALRFTRFDACQPTDNGTAVIRVRFETVTTTFNESTGAWSHPGGRSQVGANPAALPGEAMATMWIGAPTRWVNIADLRNFTLNSALHEFGHAIGLRHEHQRSDRPTDVCSAAQGTDNDRVIINAGGNNQYVGGYDPNSVMNYCRADRRAFLSQGDVNGIDALYPEGASGNVYVAASDGGRFNGTADKWHGWFCIQGEICETADVTGDGIADLVTFTRGNTGDVYVAVGTGTGFHGVGMKFHDWFCVADEVCKLADVNGDGRADLVAFTRGSAGDVYVALSNGWGFDGTGVKWHDWFCIYDEVCEVGDVDGDRKADLIAFTRGSAGDVYVATSTGAGFVGTGVKWHDWFCIYDEVCKVADVSGDGRADLVTFTRGETGDVFVATSTGSEFVGTGVKWHDWFCVRDEVCEVGDVNGDGRADLVTFTRGETGDVYVATSTGTGFAGTGVKWHDWFCIRDEVCKVGDVNGDRKVDLLTFVRH